MLPLVMLALSAEAAGDCTLWVAPVLLPVLPFVPLRVPVEEGCVGPWVLSGGGELGSELRLGLGLGFALELGPGPELGVVLGLGLDWSATASAAGDGLMLASPVLLAGDSP